MKPILLTLALFNLLSASAQQSVTPADIATGEKLFDLSFTQAKLDSMLTALTDRIKTYNYFHKNGLSNDAPFPLSYSPILPGMKVPTKQLPVQFTIPINVAMPTNKAELAFYSIPQLASLIKHKKSLR